MVVVSNQPYGNSKPDFLSEKSEDLNCRETNGVSYNESNRPLSAEALLLKSPKTVLELLNKGVKEQNMAIVKQCVCNLDQRIDQTNALIIFMSLSKYITSANNNYEPSAPPMDAKLNWLQDLIQNLRHSCLLEMDQHADFVLKQAEILQLNYNDLLTILERDTLQVSNESLVYVIIYKWAVDECHRRGLDEHYFSNLRNVLQQLQYSPRYGLLSKNKFTSKIIEGVPGPTRSGILDEKDWRLIKFYIKEKAKNRPVKDLPHKWSTPRILCKGDLKGLHSGCPSPVLAARRNTTTCERCFINFLSCWIAVFD